MTLRRSLTLLAVALTGTGGAMAAAETAGQQRSEVTLSATSWGYADSATPTTAYTLGINIKVAVAWQQAASGDWTAYAADVSRRNHDLKREFSHAATSKVR